MPLQSVQVWLSHTKEERWPKPYDQGFTNLIYTVRATTNLGHALLPLKSEYFCFMPSLLEVGVSLLARDDLRLHKRVTLQTLFAASRSSRKDLLPELPGLTYVRDSRFMNVHPRAVDYAVSNRWLTETEVKKLPAYREAAASRRMTAQANPAVRWGFIALLLLVASFPLGRYFWRRVSRPGSESHPVNQREIK